MVDDAEQPSTLIGRSAVALDGPFESKELSCEIELQTASQNQTRTWRVDGVPTNTPKREGNGALVFAEIERARASGAGLLAMSKSVFNRLRTLKPFG